jgi:phospholipid/cholesterol/gamma-HCH transport system permease protein
MIYRFFAELGAYWLFLRQVFRRPERFAEYRKAFWRDVDALGVKTLPLVAIISLFMGAVVTIQTALNLDDPLIPRYYIAIAVRESILLEFAPTIVSLILAGIVGSNISGSIGNMRITEQIDALEVMAVNPLAFLVAPRLVGILLVLPALTVLSIFVMVASGYAVAVHQLGLNGHVFLEFATTETSL